MSFKTVFKRYELKYLITDEQKRMLLDVMSGYMEPDKYGRCTVRNLYFDTPSYRLIRRSMEKPVYKEKLRVRCYSTAREDTTVFVELKKKYKQVVYKRRISLDEKTAMEWLCQRKTLDNSTQISREIDYFMDYYDSLSPTVYLSYDREAFFSKTDSSFRITFDSNIMCRQNDLSLCSEPYGNRIISEGQSLMEIKCGLGMPLWVTEFLSKEKIYKTSFSKYAMAYKNYIFQRSTGYAKESV